MDRSGHTQLADIRASATSLLHRLIHSFDRRLRVAGDRASVPYGSFPSDADEPGLRHRAPSSRLTADIALGYLAESLLTQDVGRFETACALLRHVFDQQHEAGYFVWNYRACEIDEVDLGTVLDTYYWFWTRVPDLPADIRQGIIDSTASAIMWLKTAEQPAYPGIIQKRQPLPGTQADRPHHHYQQIDVINGNALAITAYCRAAAILQEPALIDRAEAFQQNLCDALGRHAPGWWYYTERLDDRAGMRAQTILFQAMTALYLEPLWRARPNAQLKRTLQQSLATLDTVVDEQGALDWAHESREDFVQTPLLMLPSAAVALQDVHDITAAGLRRMRYVENHLVDAESGLLSHERGGRRHGQTADELRQIWSLSDLALIVLRTA